jgi:arabinofuranosyltransferase
MTESTTRLEGLLSDRRVFACIVIGLLLLYAWHAYLYWFLCDDAFITFRYVRNLLLGRGLVFNEGERVEGYTDFLWVLQLAGLGAGGVPLPTASWLLSCVYSVLTLGMVWRLCGWFEPLAPRRFLFVGTLAFLATHRSFAAWTTSGLETRSFTFFVLLALGLSVEARNSRRRAWQASAALAAVCLTRPDGLLVFSCVLLWWLLIRGRRGDLALPRLLRLALPALAIVGAHFAFRWIYYGGWVPNTYYAKVVRPWPEMGFTYMSLAVVQHGLWLTGPLAALGAYVAARHPRCQGLGLLLLTPLVHASYLIYIGGDYFEFRPLDFYWPIFYLLVSMGLGTLWESLRQSLSGRRLVSELIWISTCLVAFLASTVLPAIAYLDNYEKQRWQEVSPGFQPLGALGWVEEVPLLGGLVDLWSRLARSANSQIVGPPVEAFRLFWREKLREWRDAEGLAESGLLPRTVAALEGELGVAGYMLDVRILDPRGLTDAVISRFPPQELLASNSKRWLGHDRRPPAGYLELWGVNTRIAPPDQAHTPLEAGQYRYRLRDGRSLKFTSHRPEWVWQAFDPERLRPWYAQTSP